MAYPQPIKLPKTSKGKKIPPGAPEPKEIIEKINFITNTNKTELKT